MFRLAGITFFAFLILAYGCFLNSAARLAVSGFQRITGFSESNARLPVDQAETLLV